MNLRFPVLDHLVALTDDTGVIQHATHDVPNRATGYCTDDVARALIVAVDAARNRPTTALGTRLVTTYLAYLHDAQTDDGWFHNFMGFDRTWQDRRGSPDSFGRAMWGLGYCLRFAPRDSWRALAERLLRAGMPHVADLVDLRANAYVVLGSAHAIDAAPAQAGDYTDLLSTAAAKIAAGFATHSRAEWQWCEPVLTYDNARLSEALIRAGTTLDEPRLVEIGLQMLDFLTRVTIEDGRFMPVGNNGWYPRGGVKARFGQQPIEAAATIDAMLAARVVSGDVRYSRNAQIVFDWFGGANPAGSSLVVNGGCCDGIDPTGINVNMGAESTLAYLQASIAIGTSTSARLQIAR